MFTVVCGIAGVWAYYIEHTSAIPARGGKYSEALVGEPQFINPILLGINDADKDIAALVYSGLMKYDTGGTIVPDLAARYEISNDGKEYIFYLRHDAKWHDGGTVTAEDVVFTFTAILDPDYGSPQRASLQGMKAEKIDDYTVKLTLPYPYAQFLERMTIGIIPKHAWEKINPKNVNLANANLTPVGSGPYRFVKFTKDKYGNIVSFSLAANDQFYGGAPFISAIDLLFYNNNNDAVKAYRAGEVMGLGGMPPRQNDALTKRDTQIYELNVPKYFAVFFNQSRNKALADKNVRTALTQATDKAAIAREVLNNTAAVIDSPILPWLFGYDPDIKKYPYSLDNARATLENAGWKDKNNDGVREKIIGKDKEATPLAITLVTSDLPDLIQTGEMIKTQWEKVGAQVTLETYTIDELKQQVIKQRRYEALLFGEALSHAPDPYLFWHSSQKRDPGLNLALYDNKDADKLLETIRGSLKEDERIDSLKKFQQILANEIPAVFLYSPHYLYAISKDVHNINVVNISAPARRFTAVETWYSATTRVKKIQ